MSASDDFAASLIEDFNKRSTSPAPTATAAPEQEDIGAALMKQAAQQNTPPKPTPKPEPVERKLDDRDFEGSTLDFAIPIPGLTDKRINTPIPADWIAKPLAQFGSGLDDVGLGLQQLMGKASKEEGEEKKKMDEPLTKGVVGTTLNMAGKAAPFVAGAAGGMYAIPALAGAGTTAGIPWLATGGAGNLATASALTPWLAAAPVGYGALQGAMEPVGTSGPGRGFNTVLGAVTAGMGPAAHKIFGLGEDKIAGPLAKEAAAQGYQVTPGDANTKGITAFLRDKMGGMPVVGQRGSVREANQATFGEKVAKSWGGTGDSLHPEQFAKDGDALATQITGMYKNNPLTITNQFEKKLEDVGNKVAASDAGRTEVKKITDEIAGARVYNKQTGQYTADGEKIQTVLENLEARMRGDPKAEMNKVRQGLYDTIKAEYTSKMKPEDAERLAQSLQKRKAWDAMKTYVEKTGVGESGRVRGQLSPDDVAAAARAMGVGSNAELSKTAEIGQHLLRPTGKSPSFGTSIPALAGSTALTTAGALPSIAVNSPLAYKALQNPILKGVASRVGSPVTRPLAVQGALSATEAYANNQQRGREKMQRQLGR
jgi:hypothetical protein